jgi:hypothetical protein
MDHMEIEDEKVYCVLQNALRKALYALHPPILEARSMVQASFEYLQIVHRACGRIVRQARFHRLSFQWNALVLRIAQRKVHVFCSIVSFRWKMELA